MLMIYLTGFRRKKNKIATQFEWSVSQFPRYGLTECTLCNQIIYKAYDPSRKYYEYNPWQKVGTTKFETLVKLEYYPHTMAFYIKALYRMSNESVMRHTKSQKY